MPHQGQVLSLLSLHRRSVTSGSHDRWKILCDDQLDLVTWDLQILRQPRVDYGTVLLRDITKRRDPLATQ